MKQVILVRYGELHLKGGNRPFFERKLYESMTRSLKGIDCKVIKTQGRYFVENFSEQDRDRIIEKLTKVSGIHSLSVALAVDKDWETVSNAAVELMREEVSKRGDCTFKVFARRSDKRYPKGSTQMAPELGEIILENVPGTKVLMHGYDLPVGVEIRAECAYLYTGEVLCSGGMPAGSNGKAALLLSGGIDSPVAGYMVQNRGVALECVHFHSFPYTGERAKQKVVDLAQKLAEYGGRVRLHVVGFTKMQLAIHEKCPETQTTILLRRAMMQIAERIAQNTGCAALVTGEAIGQVASQTLESLACTDDAVQIPVFRPCIGMDKMDIISIAKKIDTFETSILPYEDCCTIFTPKHPTTKPKVADIRASQALLENWSELIGEALQDTEVIILN